MLTDPDARGVSVGSQGGERSLLTYAEFEQLRDQSTVFSGLMASQSSLDRIQARVDGGEPERFARAWYRRNTSARWECRRCWGERSRSRMAARREPLLTRSSATTTGSAASAGRADILGVKLAMRGGVFSIIGVAPASFFGETVGERPDAWLPLSMQAVVLPGRDWLHDNPGSVEKVMWLHVFGRLKPGRDHRASPSREQRHLSTAVGELLRLGADAGGSKGIPRSAPETTAGRHRGLAASRPVFRAAVDAVGCIGRRPADRLRQPWQSAAGARHGEEPRDLGASGIGREPRAPDPPVAHRKRRARRAGRHRRVGRGLPAASRPAAPGFGIDCAGGPARCPPPRLRVRADAAGGAHSRDLSGLADNEGRRRGRAEGAGTRPDGLGRMAAPG